MSYFEIKGNLFNSNALAFGNTVNCYGIMGKGIALEFRRRFPSMFRAYQQDCEQKKLIPGKIYYYSVGKRLILNIATKDHWRYPSRLVWIESALEQFVKEYKQKDIASIALPLLGVQSGGLNKEQVRKIMRDYLQDLNDILIEVYEFDAFSSDPLFLLLKDLCVNNSINHIHAETGLTKIPIQKMVDLIKTGRVQSMAGLTESKVLGEKSLDKLYDFLIRKSSDQKVEKPVQLNFF